MTVRSTVRSPSRPAASVSMAIASARRERSAPVNTWRTRPCTSRSWSPSTRRRVAPANGISARTMEQECGRDERSPAASPSTRASGKPPVATGHKPPRCGRHCASSNGDPHMRTVDGVPYDFQAAGEFTLLETPDGAVDVQVRQEPAAGVERGSSRTTPRSPPGSAITGSGSTRRRPASSCA